MEQWNNGFWPPARRAYGSERIMQCWINGPATGGIDDKIRMAIILLKTNIPAFHHSIIPFPGQIRNPKKLNIINSLQKFRDLNYGYTAIGCIQFSPTPLGKIFAVDNERFSDLKFKKIMFHMRVYIVCYFKSRNFFKRSGKIFSYLNLHFLVHSQDQGFKNDIQYIK